MRPRPTATRSPICRASLPWACRNRKWAILGEPTSVTQEEVVQGKQVTWTYGDSRVLQFDTSGQLTKK